MGGLVGWAYMRQRVEPLDEVSMELWKPDQEITRYYTCPPKLYDARSHSAEYQFERWVSLGEHPDFFFMDGKAFSYDGVDEFGDRQWSYKLPYDRELKIEVHDGVPEVTRITFCTTGVGSQGFRSIEGLEVVERPEPEWKPFNSVTEAMLTREPA